MKGKVINVLTVCLVTLAVLSPELVVFGVIWQRHLELEKIQISKIFDESDNLNTRQNSFIDLEVTDTTSFLDLIEAKQELDVISFMEELSSLLKKYNFFVILQRLLLLIPIGIALSIFIYDRYLIYRAAIYKQQVEMLEKMWHYNVEK